MRTAWSRWLLETLFIHLLLDVPHIVVVLLSLVGVCWVHSSSCTLVQAPPVQGVTQCHPLGTNSTSSVFQQC